METGLVIHVVCWNFPKPHNRADAAIAPRRMAGSPSAQRRICLIRRLFNSCVLNWGGSCQAEGTKQDNLCMTEVCQLSTRDLSSSSCVSLFYSYLSVLSTSDTEMDSPSGCPGEHFSLIFSLCSLPLVVTFLVDCIF